MKPPREPRAAPALPGSRTDSLLGIAVVLAFTAGTLWLALAAHPIGDTFTETDFYGAYADGARMIQRGQLVPSRYGVVGPGYEALLALAGLAVPDLFLAAKLLSILAAAIVLLCWRGLLGRIAGMRVALLATAFLATNAHFFRHAGAATTDAAALALQAGALLALLATRSHAAALGAGLLGATAFLTRYSGVYLLPAGLLAIALGGTARRERGRAAGAFAAGFLLPVGGWLAFAAARGGVPFQLHHNLAFEVYAHARGIIWDEYQRTLEPGFRSLADVLARDPGAVAARVLWNLGDHVRSDFVSLLGWPVGAAVILGVVAGALDGALRRLWPALAAGGLAYLTLVPTFYSERYALAVLPAYAALAALALASPRFPLALGRRPVALAPLLALLPLGAATWSTVALERRLERQLPVEVLDAAPELRARARPGDLVIARKPHLGWVVGLGTVPFPQTGTLEGLAAFARERRARWLWASRLEVEGRPAFWHLLDTTAVVPGLAPRRVTRIRPGVLYEIGPGFGAAPAWMASDTLRAYHAARGILLVNPDALNALLVVAAIERRRGRLEEALPALERAAAVAPQDDRVRRLLEAVRDEARAGPRGRAP